MVRVKSIIIYVSSYVSRALLLGRSFFVPSCQVARELPGSCQGVARELPGKFLKILVN